MLAAGDKQHFPSDTAIQALIQSRIGQKGAIGIVVGLIEADGSKRVFTADEAGPESKPLSESSVFEIGSITKVFTSILLADMAAKGELVFEDPVAKFLPKEKVTMPTRGGKEITLLDLSTHHSGLPRTPDNFNPADAVLLTNSIHDNDDIGLHLINPSLALREPPKKRAETKVAIHILESYTGDYQIQEKFVITTL